MDNDKLLTVLRKYGDRIHGQDVRSMPEEQINAIWENILIMNVRRMALDTYRYELDGNTVVRFTFENGCVLNVYFNGKDYVLSAYAKDCRPMRCDTDLYIAAREITAM